MFKYCNLMFYNAVLLLHNAIMLYLNAFFSMYVYKLA